MGHLEKLEALYEHIANGGDSESANKMFHKLVVEMASDIYAEMETPEIEPTMDMGGDFRDDFVDDVEADPTQDTFGDDEFSLDGAEDAAQDGTVEDRVNELETELEMLKAEFDRLMTGAEDFDSDAESEGSESDDEDFDFDVDSEDSEEDESEEDESEEVKEATNFYNKVSVNMKKEEGGVNTDNTFARGKKFTDNMAGGPHEIGLGGDEKGGKKATAKKHDVEDNIDVEYSKDSRKADNKEKHVDKTAKSLLGNRNIK